MDIEHNDTFAILFRADAPSPAGSPWLRITNDFCRLGEVPERYEQYIVNHESDSANVAYFIDEDIAHEVARQVAILRSSE